MSIGYWIIILATCFGVSWYFVYPLLSGYDKRETCHHCGRKRWTRLMRLCHMEVTAFPYTAYVCHQCVDHIAECHRIEAK